MKKVLLAAAGVVMLAGASVAVADSLSSSKQSDFFAPGRHQFYVWCTGHPDYTAIERGRSAEDAQMKLYNAAKAAGHASCWPIWQGRIAG